MSRLPKVLVGASVAVAVGTTSMVAIAGSGEEQPGLPGAQPSTPRIDGAAMTTVGAFRRPRNAEDALPPDIATFVARAGQRGGNPTLSRRALSTNGRAVYLVPSNDGVCGVLVQPGAPTPQLCHSLSELQAGAARASASLSRCSSSGEWEAPVCEAATLFGIVPDGVKNVTVGFAAGAPVSTPVQSNAYVVDIGLAARPLTISYQTAVGKVEQPVPIP